MLEGYDGVDVINLMHEHKVKTPVVICSGMEPSIVSSIHDLLRENKLSYAGTLTKPFTLAQFQEILAFTPQAIESELPADQKTSEPTILGHDIKVGMRLGWFKSVFQPQIDPLDGKITGVECLARLHHPLYGECHPGMFLPTISKQNMMDEFTLVIMRDALSDLVKMPLRDGAVISFNIDSASVNRTFMADFVEVIEEYFIEPSRICLEITDLSVLELSKDIKAILTKLRIKGFYVSLDEFGTGFSTIKELNELPFNEVKIDRTFVMSMLDKSSSMAIIRSTVQLAQQLNYRVVAEGVVTQMQAEQLLALGCTDLQGFHYCRPMNAPQCSAFIERFPSH